MAEFELMDVWSLVESEDEDDESSDKPGKGERMDDLPKLDTAGQWPDSLCGKAAEF